MFYSSTGLLVDVMIKARFLFTGQLKTQVGPEHVLQGELLVFVYSSTPPGRLYLLEGTTFKGMLIIQMDT